MGDGIDGASFYSFGPPLPCTTDVNETKLELLTSTLVVEEEGADVSSKAAGAVMIVGKLATRTRGRYQSSSGIENVFGSDRLWKTWVGVNRAQ